MKVQRAIAITADNLRQAVIQRPVFAHSTQADISKARLLTQRLPTLASLLLVCLVIGGCGRGKPPYTPTPTKTPIPINPPMATIAQVVTATPGAVSSLGDKSEELRIEQQLTAEATTATASLAQGTLPTQTPVPLATPVLATPALLPSESPATPLPPAQTATLTPDHQPVPLAAPQRGGSWDMEEGFYF